MPKQSSKRKQEEMTINCRKTKCISSQEVEPVLCIGDV